MSSAEPDNSGLIGTVADSHAKKADQYVVVARRYRPQTFEELIGQSTVARALRNAIESNRVGHAYLFTGGRGVGKTSAARIFAKALNCTRGPTVTPCNNCDICLSVAAGEDVDVLEIDGASNRGIDEIRQLRSNVQVRPSRTHFKIYIIDEVHMLTREAFNALLKTLEEPPKHAKFIFCTTDPQKIPITVLSRCQRFDFAPIDVPAIAQRLEQIVQAEGAEADAEALKLLARRAAGSMRDSQSLLEQLLAFGDDRITLDSVHRMLGTAQSVRLTKLVQHLIRRDAAAALGEFDAALGEGVDVGQLTEQLLGFLRDIMATAVGCGPDLMLSAGDVDHAVMSDAANQWGLATVLAAVQVLDQSVARMRQSVHVRTLAEVAIVRIARLEDLEALEELIAQLQTNTATSSTTMSAVSSGAAEKSAPSSRNPEGKARVKKKLDSQASATNARKETGPSSSADAKPAGDFGEVTQESCQQIWLHALDHLNDMTADFARQFESVAISAPNRLVVSFTPKYNSSKLYCERPEQCGRLEQAVSAITGRTVRLEFQLLDSGTEQPPEKPVVSARTRMREVHSHPMVRQAMEMFGAEVSGVGRPASDHP